MLTVSKIGGNIKGTIQTCTVEKNSIGESVKSWADSVTLNGWLALQSGDSKITNFNAKMEESTHVFLTDFNAAAYALADQDTRMVIKGFVYDVQLIDNPQEMDYQLEIYLRKVGAWNG